MTNYRQCTFRTPPEGETYTESTAYLPEKFAVVGKTIYFGKTTETPDKLWKVTAASNTVQPESYVKAHERDFTTQREASDI